MTLAALASTLGISSWALGLAVFLGSAVLSGGLIALLILLLNRP